MSDDSKIDWADVAVNVMLTAMAIGLDSISAALLLRRKIPKK
ncbi:MAG: hypothetical protein O7H41_09100 [Planctomycetota bacterium]|nr:hypothetical protein [Planctomycetota bacterium]